MKPRTEYTPHSDDGIPIQSPVKSWKRGGARAGAGRHPKPGLTAEEFAFIAERRGGKRRAQHGASWEVLAREINEQFRWRGAIDSRTRAQRGISGVWLRGAFAAEIKMRQNSNEPSGEALQHLSAGAWDSGSRVPTDYQPEEPDRK